MQNNKINELNAFRQRTLLCFIAIALKEKKPFILSSKQHLKYTTNCFIDVTVTIGVIKYIASLNCNYGNLNLHMTTVFKF